jgi:hypothetical protein
MRSRNTRALSIAAMTAGVLVAGLGTSTAHAAEPQAPDASAVDVPPAQAGPSAPESPEVALDNVLTALGNLLPDLIPGLLEAPTAPAEPAAVEDPAQLPLPDPPLPLPDPAVPPLPSLIPPVPPEPAVPGLAPLPAVPPSTPAVPAPPGVLPTPPELPLPSTPPLPTPPALPLDDPGAGPAEDPALTAPVAEPADRGAAGPAPATVPGDSTAVSAR